MALRFAVIARLTLAAVAVFAFSARSSDAVEAFSSTGKALFTTAVENAEPPPGWTEFCAQYVSECDGKTSVPRNIALTSENWRKIVGVNKWVNDHIWPKTDFERQGRENVWSFGEDGRGDCKDYVLLKRQKLIEAGLPREALLIAIVWTPQQRGHAVLIARTDQGDFVLDNLSYNVMFWSDTNYKFVERQSELDPNAWLFIDGGRPIGGDIWIAHGLI